MTVRNEDLVLFFIAGRKCEPNQKEHAILQKTVEEKEVSRAEGRFPTEVFKIISNPAEVAFSVHLSVVGREWFTVQKLGSARVEAVI